MPVNARQYREEIYRLRSHPPHKSAPTDFIDKRDSLGHVYLSAAPFLILEYMAEVAFVVLPSGIVFPMGFLLFWAFYYTYYQPGFLEERLSSTKKWDWFSIPALLIGVVIWFVKVTVVELTQLLVLRWWIPTPKKVGNNPHRRYQRRYPQPNPFQSPTKPSAPQIPTEILSALRVLGLENSRDWNEIHHRYRELAKKYHPDLNPDVTQTGNRFMLLDAAYKKLTVVKGRYFHEKR